MISQEAKFIRQGFEAYLKSKLPLGSDPAKYARGLDTKIKTFYKDKLSRPFDTIFGITNVDEVYKIKKDISSHPSLVYQRSKKGDSKLAGLDLYIQFLRSRSNQPLPPIITHTGRRLKRATTEMEGKHITREQTFIQRNRKVRQLCVDYYQCRCAACGLSMKEKYGELGEGVIEVHHLNPISLFDDTHEVDYKKDLIALCPNCHTMIHKLEDPGDIDGLRTLIKENNSNE